MIATTERTGDEVRALIASHLTGETRDVTDAFHKAWYGSMHTWGMTYWMGVATLKNPLDLWLYQEIIVALKPALIIETGTAFGGSALYCAQMMELAYMSTMAGLIVTIDRDPAGPTPFHRRIMPVVGDSLAPETLWKVRQRVETVPAGRHVVVLLDSDHSAAHVRKELDAYAGFVTPQSYLIVEDTNVNGHPVLPDHGPGPHEAVDAFLVEHPEFATDPFCEKYLLTMNPGGWLRRAA